MFHCTHVVIELPAKIKVNYYIALTVDISSFCILFFLLQCDLSKECLLWGVLMETNKASQGMFHLEGGWLAFQYAPGMMASLTRLLFWDPIRVPRQRHRHYRVLAHCCLCVIMGRSPLTWGEGLLHILLLHSARQTIGSNYIGDALLPRNAGMWPTETQGIKLIAPRENKVVRTHSFLFFFLLKTNMGVLKHISWRTKIDLAKKVEATTWLGTAGLWFSL